VLLALPLTALALPGFAEIKANYVPSEARLLARDGHLLHTLRIDKTRAPPRLDAA
jgi:hypothetical protein